MTRQKKEIINKINCLAQMDEIDSRAFGCYVSTYSNPAIEELKEELASIRHFDSAEAMLEDERERDLGW